MGDKLLTDAFTPVFLLFAGLFGLAVGSFLNVVAWRVPLGKSIVRPGSACPSCGTPISPRDNVPVLGWILLRGKCRTCRAPISVLYPVVELSTGLLFLAAGLKTGMSPLFLHHVVFLSLMVLAVRTDLEHFMILDSVSIGGTVAGLGLSFFSGAPGFVPALLAAGGAFLFFLLIRAFSVAYLKSRNVRVEAPKGFEEEEEDFQSGLGWGDVKLAACLGAFLGPGAAVAGLFISFLAGALYGVVVLIRGGRRAKPIPFGPFMAIGGGTALFFGNWLWNAYSSFGPYR
jgi:leader peptidase (prepilin peptidase)/N-methyltransferase